MSGFKRELLRELPKLVQAGVLSDAVAARIQNHYGPSQRGMGRSILLVTFAVLGGLLLGGGLILVLAHNWAAWPRGARAGMSFALLLLGQVAGAWVLQKRRDQPAWREGVSVFWSLSVGAAIALIAQTYHIPGSFDRFTLTWMVLTLPVAYLLRATAPAVLYVVGITCWSVARLDCGFSSQAYGLLLLPALPCVARDLRERFGGVAATVQVWTLGLSLVVGTGVTLSGAHDGLWLVSYALLFSVFTLVDLTWFSDQPSLWQRPLRLGALGVLVMAFIMTYPEVWEEVSWFTPHGSLWFVIPWVLSAALLMAWVLLLVPTCRRRDRLEWGWLALPSLAIPGTLVGYWSGGPQIAALLSNVYLVLLGVCSIILGFRKTSLTRLNVGLLTLGCLITLRFFHDWGSLVGRGILFMLLGGVLLSANVVIARKKGGHHA
jgi:uncharacterized membrane protein